MRSEFMFTDCSGKAHFLKDFVSGVGAVEWWTLRTSDITKDIKRQNLSLKTHGQTSYLCFFQSIEYQGQYYDLKGEERIQISSEVCASLLRTFPALRDHAMAKL